MLPRARGPHDQLLILLKGKYRSRERVDPAMKSEWLPGLVGLVVGHILWLVGISLAIGTTRVSFWVLILAASVLGVAVIAVLIGLRLYKNERYGGAMFMFGLPVSPIVFTLAVLGSTYL